MIVILIMGRKNRTELDAEFIEYKAEAKASMDALEKKIDDGSGKLDASIKAMKEESDAKFEELKQLILGSNKLDPRTTNDMNGERLKPRIDSGVLFVEGMQPTGFGLKFGVDPEGRRKNNLESMDQTPSSSTYLTSLLLADFTLQWKSKTKLGSRNHVAQDFKGTP
ncbi:hypothetical protein Tco_0857234 [Tanacetum coccineum]|uniref:Uncharacterized protein n=1 Tax=Tanacetum coccineum TaxID=301880 RepID=A0ABQ5B8D8_9ASTR